MKEEAASRKSDVHTRDQADAGTPREEAGKSPFCLLLFSPLFETSKLNQKSLSSNAAELTILTQNLIIMVISCHYERFHLACRKRKTCVSAR
jgi:hypothetical protein